MTRFFVTVALTAVLTMSSIASAQQQNAPDNNDDASISAMFETRKTEARALSPWHYKTESSVRFRLLSANSGSDQQNLARQNFGWQVVSQRLADKNGAYPDYVIYLGITKAGDLEGVVFGDAFSSMISDQAAEEQLEKFQSIGMSPVGFPDLITLLLDPVQSALVPEKNEKIWFRKFMPGNKANRMFGALPDDSEIEIFHTAADKQGSMNYWIGNQPKRTAFTIGYLKEMIKTVRGAK